MRRAARTAAITTPALVVVAAAWLRLEQPTAPLWRVLALLALALVAAAPRTGRLRAVAAVAATVAAAWVAVGVDLVPWRLLDPGAGFGVVDSLSTMGTRFGNGFSDFYGTHLPFDPRVHVAMGELVLAGIFTFALAVSLLVAARRPVAAALALLVGAGWPATLLGPSHGVAMGAAILGAALVLLAGLGSRRVPALALPAAAVVAAGAVAVGSATAASHGLVHWQDWNLAHVATGSPASVGFVWDAQYGGLHWPAKPTVVLEVRSERTPSYLRAAVLDDFTSDAWTVGQPRPADSLEPSAARRPANQTQQRVTVDGLSDNRLVGGSIPVRFAAGGAQLVQPQPGFAALPEELPRGFQYTAWSYIAQPSLNGLLHSPPAYPPALARDGMLDVGRGVTTPAFGTPNRFSTVLSLVSRNPALNWYVPLARLAQDVAGNARTPYGAVNRLQNWFLATGGFRYSNHPEVIGPPLVGFVTRTRVGYCQFFAGAMALMLRYLGIPSRVAVGFAGGAYDTHKRAYIVTDHEAHAWVEVWFKGYGWLPFDPTPAGPGAPPRATGGGVAGGGNVGSARIPNAPAFVPGGRGASTVADNLATKNGFVRGRTKHSAAGHATSAERTSGSAAGTDRGTPALILLLVLAAAAAAVVLAKAGSRMRRGVRRDPRGVAAACRQELVSFLVDQRIDVPRSLTFAELGALVHEEFGVRPEPFVAAATAARYGRPEDAPRAARAARRELRTLLDSARRGLTRRERLRGLLSLRSLARPVRAVDASASLGSGMAGGAGS